MKNHVSLQLPSIDSDAELISVFTPLYNDHRIFCFKGELGAGKTSIIKILCRDLGVVNGLSSPSFGLVNEYGTQEGDTIYHFDLYRLKQQEELIDLGWYDYLNSGCLIFVEWPEIGGQYIPADAVLVDVIADLNTDIRTISITYPYEH